jgi:zinc and cadmium transporter
MPPLVQALLATLLVSAVSLVGIFFVFADWTERRALLFMSFAAGVLLATSFLELLPEAVERHDGQGNLFVATLGAMGTFFILERFLRGFHAHDGQRDSHALSSGYLILIGDTLHNIVDGVVIAASFLVDPALGVSTTIAVAAHEIPQEVADFSILLSAGFTRRSALLLNLLSGLTAVLGALWCFWFERLVEAHLAWFIGATAGMFIYIAASDLMPELHHSRGRGGWRYVGLFVVGVTLVGLLGIFVPHRH